MSSKQRIERLEKKVDRTFILAALMVALFVVGVIGAIWVRSYTLSAR